MNKIPFHEMKSVVMMTSLAIITSRIQQRYGSQRFYGTIRDQLVASCQSSNYLVATTYQDTNCEMSSNNIVQVFCQRIIVLWPTTLKSEL